MVVRIKLKFLVYLPVVFVFALSAGSPLKTCAQYPFQDPDLPVTVRVNDLISRFTLLEKVSQLGYDVPAIERLGIPAYDYWNEALHGVTVSGLATSFPQAIALSSTWDRHLIYEVASAISDEARVKNNMDGKGLTYWSPTINMARDPRWGRTEETYGEDPYLTGQIALNFIEGMQGNHPKYLKTVATVKHFACNNIDLDRRKISSNVDERSLREYYLPAFKTCVTEGKVYSAMSAYNALNEVPCPANRTLLTNILREEWGFTGYVVSDCDAVADVSDNHYYVSTREDATALSIKSGTDLNCGGTYQYFAGIAISSGLMSEVDIDTALLRVFKARFLLGEFDPPSMVPYTSIPNNEPLVQASFDSAVALAANSDMAILVCGTDLSVATEELDRTTLDLPGVQELLILEVLRANPNTILVLVNGSTLSITGINDSIPAIIAAWYDGQAQGSAIADVLFGDYNPGGKLTSTWHRSVTDLPPMDDYDIKNNRTYMYFTGEPLYPFGFGLSYTTFEYSDLVKSSVSVGPGDSVVVSVSVKNMGEFTGDEVAQFYIHHISPAFQRPFKELKDFQRIHLEAGETKQVTFTLKYADLAFYDEPSRTFIIADGTVDLQIGSSSEDIRLSDQVTVTGSVVFSTYRQDPFFQFEAESFGKKSNSLSVEGCSEGGQNIRFSTNNDFVEYKNMNFGTGAFQFNARVGSVPTNDPGDLIEIRLDSLDGSLIGTLLLMDGSGPYQTRSCLINNIQGVHDLFLVFTSSGSSYVRLNWFTFLDTTATSDNFNYGFYLYPNPAISQFSLSYLLPCASEISLEIYTVSG